MASKAGSSGGPPRLNEKVLLRGVGKYWSDGIYAVKVVDIRKSDDTVKVRVGGGEASEALLSSAV